MINDTNYETLFWSLMEELQEVDTEEAMLIWEKYEIIGVELSKED